MANTRSSKSKTSAKQPAAPKPSGRGRRQTQRPRKGQAKSSALVVSDDDGTPDSVPEPAPDTSNDTTTNPLTSTTTTNATPGLAVDHTRTPSPTPFVTGASAGDASVVNVSSPSASSGPSASSSPSASSGPSTSSSSALSGPTAPSAPSTSSGSFASSGPSASTSTPAADRIAELQATILRQQALLDKAKKSKAVQEAKTKLIEKPAKIVNLAEAMQLKGRNTLYNHCRAFVKTACHQAGILPEVHWHKQDVLRLGRAAAHAEKLQPQLKRYAQSWATFEIMKTVNKNRRSYTVRCEEELGIVRDNDEGDENRDDGNYIDVDDVEEETGESGAAVTDGSPVIEPMMEVDYVNGGKGARKRGGKQAGKQPAKRQKTL